MRYQDNILYLLNSGFIKPEHKEYFFLPISLIPQ